MTRFLRQLRFADQAIPSLAWIEPWLAEEGLNAEDAAARANERVALTQVMTANSITSLRVISRLDWKALVERSSVLETALRADPAGVYPRMTFKTRDHYRHVVERIAKRTKRSERDVAETALKLAAEGQMLIPDDEARGHVGYYLVDAGLPALEAATGYTPSAEGGDPPLGARAPEPPAHRRASASARWRRSRRCSGSAGCGRSRWTCC